MVGELRSIVRAPMVALTATASANTKSLLIRYLGLTGCAEIVLSPDRPNVYLSVVKVSEDLVKTFNSLIHELRVKRVECQRCLVYCRSIADCATLFAKWFWNFKAKAASPC